MSKNEDIELRRQVLLAFQVALLGMTTPRLRGVTITWNSNQIIGVFFYDGAVTEEEEEIVSDIEAEIIADFPKHIINLQPRSYEAPANLADEQLKAWVYRRME